MHLVKLRPMMRALLGRWDHPATLDVIVAITPTRSQETVQVERCMHELLRIAFSLNPLLSFHFQDDASLRRRECIFTPRLTPGTDAAAAEILNLGQRETDSIEEEKADEVIAISGREMRPRPRVRLRPITLELNPLPN